MIQKSRFLVVLVLGFTTLGLIMAGCAAPSPVASPIPSPQTSASSPPVSSPTASAGTLPEIDHVVIVVEENKPASSILGNADAPYFNKLAADNALATNYQAATHPSLPNYLALTSGTTAGIKDDCSPGADCTARVPSIADTIEKAGRTWKMYAESMPAPCTAKNSGLYAVKHNPFMYYPGVTDNRASCEAHVVPFTQLSDDLKSAASLPNYVFISPNLCNDMHDCPVSTGDAWLSEQVPKILDSPAFTTKNSLLVITWDEGKGDNNAVSTVFAGPAARRSHESSVAYSHYSLLHTIEILWGLEPLTDKDKNAAVMTDMLK
ncbi:alkaline phosphatase family protein [Arthrobacter sp. E3]|uniref:alkaline phosphatase family protein n=1 Tax=Arthrobacter sp. E3 TaxID=517402 RepID=UPI001A940B87|nr:alkaline phosphatase family protein [Arthrobacter sp. E3]